MVNTKEDGDILSSFRYSYDQNGNREAVTDHTGKTISYEYDGLNQLLSETDLLTDNRIFYQYDQLGNRISKTIKDTNGVTLESTTYQYNQANELKEVNNQANELKEVNNQAIYS